MHQLLFGVEVSAIEKFQTERQAVRSEESFDVLVTQYGATVSEIRTIKETEAGDEDSDGLKRGQLGSRKSELNEKRSTLMQEIQERESKYRAARDTVVFGIYGVLLIIVGTIAYRMRFVWPGIGLVITGFCILQCWASESFFRGNAIEGFRQLLFIKLGLSIVCVLGLYAVWVVFNQADEAATATVES
jgi:hypothetical protein